MANDVAVREGRVILRDPHGDIVNVDPRDAQGLLNAGYAPMSETDTKAEEHRIELETPKAIAETAVRSGVDAFTAPVEWTLNKLGLPEAMGVTPEQQQSWQQRTNELRAANPFTAFAADVVGQTAGLKGLGVLGGAARVGEAATAGAGKLAGAIARGGLEGAAYGAVAEMQADPRADAEHVLAAGGLGALLGAGTGAVLQGPASTLSSIFKREGNTIGAEAAAMAEATEAAESSAARSKGGIAKAWDNITNRVSGAPKELLEEVGPTGKRRAEAIQAAEGFDHWADKTALSMQEKVNEAHESLKDVTRLVSDHHLKESGVRAMVEDSEPKRIFGQSLMSTVRDKFSEAIENLDTKAPGLGGTRRQLEVLGREMDQAVSAMTESKDVASRYIALDDTKRRMQKTILQMRQDAQSPRVGMTSYEKDNLLATASKVEEIQEELRQSLMNPKAWGEKLAKAQKEINDVWADGAIEALDQFGHQFQRWTGSWDYDTGRKIFEADPAAILQSLKSIGTANGKIAERSMDQYLYHLDRLVEKIGDNFQLSEASAKSLETARSRFGELRTMFDEARDRTKLANQFRELQSYKAGGLLAHGGITGAVLGHGPGFVLGEALRAASNPAETAKFVQGLAGNARAFNQSNILDSVGKWIKSGATTVQKVLPKSSNIQRIGTSAAVNLFTQGHKNLDDATQARTKALLQADPEKLGDHFADLPDETMFHAGAAASAGISYLRSQLPPYLSSPTLLNSTKRLAISQPDMVKFARVWGTIVDPRSAVKDLKAGRFTPAQADALSKVYPGLYNDLRQTTLESIGQADAAGKPLPIQVREQLSILLKLDGAGEPALSGAFADRIQKLMSQQNQQNGERRPPAPTYSRVAQTLKSPFENLI